MVRLATKKLLVSIDVVVDPKILATILADKHMANVLVRPLQRLEIIVL